MEIKKGECEQVGSENAYTYLLTHDVSKDMQGMYNMEVMIVAEGGYQSIFKQENLFAINNSKIGK